MFVMGIINPYTILPDSAYSYVTKNICQIPGSLRWSLSLLPEYHKVFRALTGFHCGPVL